jgi:hypothetical protein
MDGSAIFNSFDGNTAYDSYDQPMTSPNVTQVIDYVTQSILTGQEVPPAAMEYLTNNGVTQNQIDQSIDNARYEEIIKSFENPTELTGPTIDTAGTVSMESPSVVDSQTPIMPSNLKDTAYLDPNLIDVAPENVTIESRGLPTLLNNSDEYSDLGTIDVKEQPTVSDDSNRNFDFIPAPTVSDDSNRNFDFIPAPTVSDDSNRNFDFIPEPSVPDDRPYTPFEENFPIQEEPRDFDFIPPPQTPTLDFIAPQTQVQDVIGTAKKGYTYGQAGDLDPNYMLQRQINAGNVYSNATGYKPVNQNTTGEEVQNFAGGGLANMFTRVAQPFEKAILRPIGEAAPFLKDMAPYAGIAAGAMMGNPMMAAGIGGIASGFGKPGGFDMKRALMGGIAAYGMSNLAGGLEAAGTPEAALPLYPEAPIQPSSIVGSDTIFVPQGPSQAALQSMAKTDLANAPRDIFSTRNPDAIQKGIGNLLQNSNTPAYKDAMSAFTNNASIYKAGLPLIMGTTGVMGVDESNALKQEYDKATAQSQADEDKFKARVAAGKKRAQQAVSENPYMFAMGGAIDDEYGSDDMNTVNGNMQNGFMGYADGGPVTNAEDLEFMTQLENNRNEVDPMSDSRYAGLLKQNQDYLSTIYGNIYNQPTPQPVAPPPPVTVTPSVEPTPLTGAIAPPPPPPPPPTVAPLDIETVRANANRALDMSEEVQNNIRDSSRAVERAQELIGTASATPPPPVYQSPNVSPTGQYMVRNPTGPESLNSSNIYQYQKKKRGYAEGGVPRFLSGGGDGMSDSIKASIEGTQEARLADGEFVIPADVVSHLGNGSSKAGAKQLYDMMDRVRKARTGNVKQGRQIKPSKLMPV